ncbi:hypothetical protein CONCODRAFT_7392 [Conidiobolus coronatus NRRL 28638]|uniref:Uncharacterized protein n=1 Tax=Conidiobolus coronatus (strain ATCC 28846 / CBS 209.66 / NRRL 28638) TaxID=796925 RepID=A0A137P5C0_CONC2|nr:hypothetical protein CONCODRAFT_7392 [Conidiobolus coronatus NRRL 28638]|eukprot:KXN70149.1 hypothetical protein CONCODRAFT_7392 [Conidiobolus coronatus NRRL 28638]
MGYTDMNHTPRAMMNKTTQMTVHHPIGTIYTPSYLAQITHSNVTILNTQTTIPYRQYNVLKLHLSVGKIFYGVGGVLANLVQNKERDRGSGMWIFEKMNALKRGKKEVIGFWFLDKIPPLSDFVDVFNKICYSIFIKVQLFHKIWQISFFELTSHYLCRLKQCLGPYRFHEHNQHLTYTSSLFSNKDVTLILEGDASSTTYPLALAAITGRQVTQTAHTTQVQTRPKGQVKYLLYGAPADQPSVTNISGIAKQRSRELMDGIAIQASSFEHLKTLAGGVHCYDKHRVPIIFTVLGFTVYGVGVSDSTHKSGDSKRENVSTISLLVCVEPENYFKKLLIAQLSRILNRYITPVTHEDHPTKTALGQLTVQQINNARHLLGAKNWEDTEEGIHNQSKASGRKWRLRLMPIQQSTVETEPNLWVQEAYQYTFGNFLQILARRAKYSKLY